MLDIISFQIIKHNNSKTQYPIKDVLNYIQGALHYNFTDHQRIKLANQLINMPIVFQLKIRVDDRLYQLKIDHEKRKFTNTFICNLN